MLDLRPVTLEAKTSIESVTKSFAPYSDFNFASLFTWDVSGETRYAISKGNLAISFRDYLDGSPFVSILGCDAVGDFAEEVLGWAHSNAQGDTLKLVPECVAKLLSNDSRFQVRADPDNDDYILSTERLSTLAGRATAKRRMEMYRFLRAHGNAEANCEAITPSLATNIEELFGEWAHGKPESEVAPEKQALFRAVEHAAEIGVDCLTVRVDCELAGFFLFEVINGGVFAMAHYEKACRRFDGVYAYLANALGKELMQRGVGFLNYEQDLGLPGLRQAKRRLAPVSYLPKYVVTLA